MSTPERTPTEAEVAKGQKESKEQLVDVAHVSNNATELIEPLEKEKKALMLGQDHFFSKISDFWKSNSDHWKELDGKHDSSRSKPVTSDVIRAAKTFETMHTLIYSVCYKQISVLEYEAQDTNNDSGYTGNISDEKDLQRVKERIKKDSKKLNKYYEAYLGGNIGSLISTGKFAKLFGAEEEKGLEPVGSLKLSSYRDFHKSVEFWTELRRYEMPQLFEKYLVQMKICSLFIENEKDERASLFHESSVKGSKVTVPKFYQQDEAYEKRDLEEIVNERLARIRGWLKYFDSIKWVYA